MIQFKLLTLHIKDGTGSVQSFDRACATSMIERLILFLLSDPNFWVQWCFVNASILYLFEWRPRFFFATEFATACNKDCHAPGASMMCS